MKQFTRILGLLALLSFGSCALHRHTTPAPADTDTADSSAPTPAVDPPQHLGDPSQIITVMMYRLSVPYGKASQNNALWKLLDEDTVDVHTHAMLYDNGLRVGRAPVSSWDAVEKVVGSEFLDCQITGFTAISNVGSVSLNVSPDMDEETLFVLDEHGATGRTYTHCRNQLNFAFMWAPRKEPGTVRLRICPLVYVMRMRNDFSLGGEPVERKFAEHENLYDLGLRVDLPPHQFLVLGLSPTANDPNRIGNRFLARNDKLNRSEQILVFCTTRLPVRADLAPATQPSDPDAPLH